ncbi:MAG: recombinase RecT [bacterium]
MTTETAITKREGEQLPGSYQEVAGLAKAFVASGMFTDVKQISQAIVKIQAGRELGLPPVYSMQNVNIIRNRLTSSANVLAMLVKRSPHYDYRIREWDDNHCRIEFFQKGGGKLESLGFTDFSLADAKRAGLVKPDSNWQTYPKAMVFSRAISQGARAYCPDAIGGMYTDEEIRAIPDRPKAAGTIDVDTGEVKEAAPEDPIEVPPPAAPVVSEPAKAADDDLWPRAETQEAPSVDLPSEWKAFVTTAKAKGLTDTDIANAGLRRKLHITPKTVNTMPDNVTLDILTELKDLVAVTGSAR